LIGLIKNNLKAICTANIKQYTQTCNVLYSLTDRVHEVIKLLMTKILYNATECSYFTIHRSRFNLHINYNKYRVWQI